MKLHEVLTGSQPTNSASHHYEATINCSNVGEMSLIATSGNPITKANSDEGEVPQSPPSIEPSGSTIAAQAAVREASRQGIPLVPRTAGDEINRFLVCALIRESASQIKTAAERGGVRLPFQRIIRRLLDSYGRAAAESPGLFSGPKFNASMLRTLNEELCKKECSRYSQETVLSRKMGACPCQTNRRPDQN